MPQRLCCVSSCTFGIIDGTVLHYFPNPTNDWTRFNVWVTFSGLGGEDETYIFKNRRICRLHFEDKYHATKNRLTRSAIPTLHLPTADKISTTKIDAAEMC